MAYGCPCFSFHQTSRLPFAAHNLGSACATRQRFHYFRGDKDEELLKVLRSEEQLLPALSTNELPPR